MPLETPTFSPNPASSLNTSDGDIPWVQRRIRHITEIHICNLTPFPVRDAVTSALQQPAEQSQFTKLGGSTDDLGALSRMRTRKLSTNSTATRRSLRWEDTANEQKGEIRIISEVRGRKNSGSSLSRAGSVAHGSPHMDIPSSSPRTYRSPRARTRSFGSSLSSHVQGASSGGIPSQVSSNLIPRMPAFLPDNSQAGLEKVIRSRLVETFITVAVPCSQDGQEAVSARGHSFPASHEGQTTARKSFTPGSKRKVGSTADSFRPHTSSKQDGILVLEKTSSKSSPPKTVTKQSKHHSSLNDHRASFSVSSLPSRLSHQEISGVDSVSDQKYPPIYHSSIHRPSINPSFPIDLRSSLDSIDSTCLSGHRLRIDVWGKMRKCFFDNDGLEAKKDKRREPPFNEHGFEWKILEEWDVDLDELVPLSDDKASHTSELSSNCLLITLSPPGRLFCLPSSAAALSRSSTPSVGYSSDPESEMRKTKQSDEFIYSPNLDTKRTLEISRRKRRKGAKSISDSKDVATTSSWQDLFKLVTLQSCISDNENSLSEIMGDIDEVLEMDTTFVLRRKISELEAQVVDIKAHRDSTIENCQRIKSEIVARRRQLQKRAETLSAARSCILADDEIANERAQMLLTERNRLINFRSRFNPIRISLFSALAYIFPIELYSPPDLLYTILDVPLPIPLSSADPGPPLALPQHKEVNEDSIATALGYVAQVLQLAAAYLGMTLVYPVTCIGSRSLIRDDISAMVGPRMFPLFSKGVDTYRFEYGVFLLNKDIEMIMADRDLRALDPRHTLPNLKNVLLTLSHGAGVEMQNSRFSKNGSASPSISLTEVETSSSTPKASKIAGLHGEGSTPPASGTTTPTAGATDESKKARPFLGLAPFADFLRSRYPSSSLSLSTKNNPTTDDKMSREVMEGLRDETLEDSSYDGEDEEEDRRTIHGIPREVGEEGEGSDGVHRLFIIGPTDLKKEESLNNGDANVVDAAGKHSSRPGYVMT